MLTRAIIAVIVPLAAFAAPPVFQASFDGAGSGWKAIHGLAAPDAAVRYEGHRSLRIEAAAGGGDAVVESAPIPLRVGKRYEVVGWIRTEELAVQDRGGAPIAVGAAVAMASMPFDVHSVSVGGTREWTRVSLPFVATRAQDRIVLSAGRGGTLRGKAWFAGVSVDETPSAAGWPTRAALETFGPAYRYPEGGWIYLHIEGAPYERGYQHGRLMSREIAEYLARCAAELGGTNGAGQWNQYRATAGALFLRGFDKEILEEMRGIADGASDAGARWQERRIDLTDIVVANTVIELGELGAAVKVTPTGLEGIAFEKPDYKPGKPTDRCSAFAATGPATRDGKMVIAHVTWGSLTLGEQTNVLLDIKPDKGHRMLMQSYPGGIESGTDWYQNDAGVVLTETTIDQTPFNIEGTPVAFRARIAIQYGGNIDDVVRLLGTRNNGLYTNEWLIGDARTNEIAMYELGTNRTKLWRSSKNEWFGGTAGFYWGDNNTKDLDLRLEDYPDPQGPPAYIPYVPMVRDLAWRKLYNEYRGQIDEQFAFTAFSGPPLVSMTTLDAKVATSDMASHMMLWAALGKPDQHEAKPAPGQYAKNDGLYPGGYRLFDMEPPAALAQPAAAKPAPAKPAEAKPVSYAGRLWKGWVLPASAADTWFVAGSAVYARALSSPDFAKAMDAERAHYRSLKLAPQDEITQFQMEQVKGVLFLDALRQRLGDDRFFGLMSDYFRANTTKTVTAQSFLDKAGVPFEVPDPGPGATYLISDRMRRTTPAILVYGTVEEAGTNRYVAEQVQAHARDQQETEIPICKDFEVTEAMLRGRDVIFVGRPETNSALAAWAKPLGLDYTGAEFRIGGATHASEREGLMLAAKNPLDPAYMVLVIAGNSPLATVKTLSAVRPWEQQEYVVSEAGKEAAPAERRR